MARDHSGGSDQARTAVVRIVPFEPRHARAFRDLNIAWVQRHFTIEDTDRDQLEQPRERIIARGGHVLIAEDAAGAAIGCAALIPHGEGELELAKMAVADAAQGQGVGALLMAAAVAWARESGAATLYLESNDVLAPALRLYERTGFRHLPREERPVSPYARANVFMRMTL